ncbi:MAG: Stk1 family PASTA domain-containing Ser/Thr kinase [Candidatus Eremiobacteraeota bacterium]|nr:Stk1 family PASTA domain-containing Ser/Thr kinase [Candidatus Eremiobacteraeota bacterium]
MIDTILNSRYRLDAAIGEGGMAVVYRGYDLLLRRQVAIKVLRPQHAADQSFVQRFYEEARAAAKLSHPNIVNTYDVGEVDGSHYIVEEFVAGETLATIIAREKKLPESVAVRYARQICLGLGASHRADLLHRDIKPSNVLITPDDVVRVTDFGIARAANAATLSGVEAIMGSIPYASPEQLSGGALSPASDLYSLGVVLFEMVVGRQPYTADTALGVAMAHVNSPIPDPIASGADISPQLADVIVKLLQKAPADRFQTAGETLAALRRCGRREGDELDEASGSDSSTSILRRRALTATNGEAMAIEAVEPRWDMRRTAVLAGAAVLAILLIALVLAWRGAVSRQVRIPDLSGKSQVEAVAALHGVGIDAVAFKAHPDPSMTAGLVDGTDPTAGARVEPNQPVTIFLSAGPGQVAVPNIVGKDLKTATKMLAGAGLTIRMGTPLHSGAVKAGLVAQSNPAPGGLIDKGATVAVQLSVGPQTVKVPNVVSLLVDDAQSQLRKLGLNLRSNIVPSVDIPAKTVIDQDPVGGSDVRPGTTVTVDISAGPNAVVVPNVVGSSVDDARAKLEQAGLAIGAVAQAAVTDTSPGTVVGQHPDPNSQVPQGTAVDIVVAAAPATPQPTASAGPAQSSPPQAQARSTIPDVTGMTLEDARAALAKAGYSVNRVVITPGSSPNAKVVRSDPAAGSTPPGAQTSVDLTLGGKP